MPKKEITCILCPNGCDISIEYDDDELIEIEGAVCLKGKEYARQEIKNPLRTLTTSILVKGGDNNLVSVKSDKPIPLKDVMDIMEALKDLKVSAPISVGDIIKENPANVNCNIIATKEVENIKGKRR